MIIVTIERLLNTSFYYDNKMNKVYVVSCEEPAWEITVAYAIHFMGSIIHQTSKTKSVLTSRGTANFTTGTKHMSGLLPFRSLAEDKTNEPSLFKPQSCVEFSDVYLHGRKLGIHLKGASKSMLF